MTYISKGYPVRCGDRDTAYVLKGRTEYRLTDEMKALWNNGRSRFAETDDEYSLSELNDSGLVSILDDSNPDSGYEILCSSVFLRSFEKSSKNLSETENTILTWIDNSGLVLTTDELLFLCCNEIKPEEKYFGEENIITLVGIIYLECNPLEQSLTCIMRHHPKRDDVIGALLSLLKKGLVYLV